MNSVQSSDGPHAGSDMLASLMMEQASGRKGTTVSNGISLKLLGIMALTSLATFATLVTGYQMLFAHHLYA